MSDFLADFELSDDEKREVIRLVVRKFAFARKHEQNALMIGALTENARLTKICNFLLVESGREPLPVHDA